MSKAFTASLILVTLLVGGIAGFAVADLGPWESQSEQSKPTMKSTRVDESEVYTDQLFLQEMITHHEIAVTMSKEVLVHTSRKEIRKMATDIIELQTKEIEQMKRWLEEWK